MALRRRALELSVERPLGSGERARGVVRLTERFDDTADGKSPTPDELRAALERLEHELDSVVGPAPGPSEPVRSDRSLAELVETYRPRQRELIDLLLDEGELTDGEHAALAANLPVPVAAAPPPRAPPAATSAVPSPPVPAERGLPQARPVPELLRIYQIASLRQAGAVRARRQISFAEYMALKRHFESSEPAGTAGAASDRPS